MIYRNDDGITTAMIIAELDSAEETFATTIPPTIQLRPPLLLQL